MGGDHEVVTGPHDHDGVVVFEAEPGATSKQGDPLVRVLVVPLVGRRRVAGGDDALEPATPSLHEHVDDLRCWGGCKSGEEVDHRHHRPPALPAQPTLGEGSEGAVEAPSEPEAPT